jgi:hypothetical protein
MAQRFTVRDCGRDGVSLVRYQLSGFCAGPGPVGGSFRLYVI